MKRGFNKSRLEMLNLIVALAFFTVLIWFVFESALLEGKCKATLLTRENVKYDPGDPPNFTEQLVYINLSLENCTRETLHYERWVCNYTWDEEPCWIDIC